jgi:hypothetical protein
MKQQNRYFINRYFELPHEIEDKLPEIATGYIKTVVQFLPVSSVAIQVPGHGVMMETRDR